MVTTRRQSKASNGSVAQRTTKEKGSKMSEDSKKITEDNSIEETIQEETKVNDTDEQQVTEESQLGEETPCDHEPRKGYTKTEIRQYLKGFGKRVIFCTLLVILVRSLWPKVQPYVWPEDAVKEGKMYVLSNKSFRSHVSRGDHFLMMYAPWCGHCQRLKPVWEKLSKSPGVNGIKIGKVDCTAEESICKDYKVEGYPTLLYFRNGSLVEKYDGDKSLDSLKAYVKKMVGKKSSTKKKENKTKKKEL